MIVPAVWFVVALLALGGCAETDDFKDHNRPATYGAQCDAPTDCASPFDCLGPPDAGPYWPICTRPCEVATDCPVWTATGHCSGPITPVCELGFCDYVRCD